MAHFNIKKGLNLRISGAPRAEIEPYAEQRIFSVYPSEFKELRLRLLIKEGDSVMRGSPLFENKMDKRMQFLSPCTGIIKSIRRGDRRSLEEIQIERTSSTDAIQFTAFPDSSLNPLSRQQLIEHLLNSGLWPLIRQRPFDRIANPEKPPKAIFVNAAGTAPFQAEFSLILKGNECAFQHGLNALTKLTAGPVHLCKMADTKIGDFQNVQNHTFSGKHPAGNTSIHINRISPILPGDTVYTISAQDVILIGRFLQTGELPRSKIIALGGPAIKEAYRKHYRLEPGANLQSLFEQATEGPETRIINGNVLAGERIQFNSGLHYYGSEYFALKEDRSRHLLGWSGPGWAQYSAHRTTLASLFRRKKEWALGTSLHGHARAMVVTGWMDKYQPLNIMTDYLVRAALTHDTEEMVQLGILEVVPEDFALAAFTDPHKTDVCEIIAHGIEEVEAEGIYG